MAKQYTCEEVKTRLQQQINAGKPIIIAGAGTGISGKFSEQGGVDLIGVYNSGLFRMDGKGSLAGLMPYGDANQIVIDLAHRIFPVIKETPMIAGICGTDPNREMRPYLQHLQHLGFSAIMNFPTVGLIDGRFRQELEDTGMGYSVEINTLKIGKELGLFTLGYAFNVEEARLVGQAQLDVLICHMGLTAGGSIGSKYAEDRLTLEKSADLVNQMTKAAREGYKEIMIFAHGGPIAYPEDTRYIYENTECVGFLGASSIERIPIEVPLKNACQEFKNISIKKK
ncbi:MAG: phosphoenolpyruvate hydrolase family protein [Syntrophomonadaceae bacterium]|nr:phosphoenolpyruvate hydrolase family protein [Bacillota bacterium]NLP25553.1 phosphoenolpyruvate hydrolase family protein [Syntrophomonadaceae bacterium]